MRKIVLSTLKICCLKSLKLKLSSVSASVKRHPAVRETLIRNKRWNSTRSLSAKIRAGRGLCGWFSLFPVEAVPGTPCPLATVVGAALRPGPAASRPLWVPRYRHRHRRVRVRAGNRLTPVTTPGPRPRRFMNGAAPSPAPSGGPGPAGRTCGRTGGARREECGMRDEGHGVRGKRGTGCGMRGARGAG